MKVLALFNLKKRVFNKLNILTDLLLLLVVIVLFNIDRFQLINNEYSVYYDLSCSSYESYFQQLTDYQYTNLGIKDNQILIHYNQGFIIACNSKIDEEVLSQITKSLQEILKAYYEDHYPCLKEYVEEIDASLIQIQTISLTNKPDFTMIGTVVYFMLLNYANLVANEIAFEKFSGVSTLVLMQVNSMQHLFSKILLGYLVPTIKLLYFIFIFMVIGLFRYRYDQFEGLLPAIQLFLNSLNEETSFSFSFQQLLLLVGVVVSSLLLIQVVMLRIIITIKNQHQVASLQGVIYIMLLILYFLFVQYGSKFDYSSIISQVISFIPGVSMLVMSCRIIIKSVTIVEVIISILLNIITLYLLILVVLPKYKQYITS